MSFFLCGCCYLSKNSSFATFSQSPAEREKGRAFKTSGSAPVSAFAAIEEKASTNIFALEANQQNVLNNFENNSFSSKEGDKSDPELSKSSSGMGGDSGGDDGNGRSTTQNQMNSSNSSSASVSSDEGSVSSPGYRVKQKKDKKMKKIKGDKENDKADKRGGGGGGGIMASCCCCLRPFFSGFSVSGADSSSSSNEAQPTKSRLQEEQMETIKLLLLGLDNAGKTTVALRLAGKSVNDVVSTIGFSNYELLASRFYHHKSREEKLKKREAAEKRAKRRREREANGGIWMGQVEKGGQKDGGDSDDGDDEDESEEEEEEVDGYPPPDPDDYRIVLYDLGGGSRIRSIWRNYYALVHGVIFVVDSTDYGRIPEVRQLLDEVIRHEMVDRKPVLIFLNKQDLPDAMDEIDICKFTTIQQLIDEYQCVLKIKPIIANATPGSEDQAPGSPEAPVPISQDIESSLRWMLDYIFAHWVSINIRVLADSEAQVAKEADSMKARIERSKAKQQFIEIETVVKKEEEEEAEPVHRPVEEEISKGQVDIKVTNETVFESDNNEVQQKDSADMEANFTSVSMIEPGKLHPPTSSLSTIRSLSPIEEASTLNEEEDNNAINIVQVKETIHIANNTSEVKEMMKGKPKTGLPELADGRISSFSSTFRQSNGNSNINNSIADSSTVGQQPHNNPNNPPMEIIVTQPGSSGSSTGSSSYLLGGRSNKVYPS